MSKIKTEIILRTIDKYKVKILAKNEIKTKYNSNRERKLKWSTIAAQFRKFSISLRYV